MVSQNKLDMPQSKIDLVGVREACVVAQETQKAELELGHVQLVLFNQ